MKHLKVYQLAVELYKGVKATSSSMNSPMNSTEKDQLMRASLSIVLNIAEGSGKPHRKDRLKYLYTAMGSLRETQALLSILDLPNLQKSADHVGAVLYRFIQNPGGK